MRVWKVTLRGEQAPRTCTWSGRATVTGPAPSASGIPSHGFALYRNGSLPRKEVIVNVACKNTTGVVAVGTVSAGLLSRSTVNRTVPLTAASDP